MDVQQIEASWKLKEFIIAKIIVHIRGIHCDTFTENGCSNYTGVEPILEKYKKC